MKIYVLRYSQEGYEDGIRLFTTQKAAERAAQTAMGWGAWRATIYESEKVYKNEIDFKIIGTIYGNRR